jgi:hypothetical protein
LALASTSLAGVQVFFQRLFNKKMGIPLTDNVAIYLMMKEKTWVKRLAKLKTRTSKINKSQNKHDRLKDETKIAKMECPHK